MEADYAAGRERQERELAPNDITIEYIPGRPPTWRERLAELFDFGKVRHFGMDGY